MDQSPASARALLDISHLLTQKADDHKMANKRPDSGSTTTESEATGESHWETCLFIGWLLTKTPFEFTCGFGKVVMQVY